MPAHLMNIDFGLFPGGAAVSKYIEEYRRPGLPPLEFGQPLDLFPEKPLPEGYEAGLTWKHTWPFVDRTGVYMIYSDNLTLLYIGETGHLGERLYRYFKGGKACVIRDPGWVQVPRFVKNIAVPVEMAWEARGLEAFLIQELQPINNVRGIKLKV